MHQNFQRIPLRFPIQRKLFFPEGQIGDHRRPVCFAVSGLLITLAFSVSSSWISAQDPTKKPADHEKIDAAWFEKKIRPILQDHCLECHSHDSGTIESELALDSKSGWLKGGNSGPAIDPENPTNSLLLKAINHSGKLQMPPEDKLSAAKIRLIEQWIQSGAPAPDKIQKSQTASSRDWWSLQPIRKPRPPISFAEPNPIDRFINHQLAQKGLKPSSPASRTALIRRLYYDLHGIPPTPHEVNRFINDSDPNAWEKRIDRLLNSPRYGERWARHWLDTVHFADTHGCEHDVFRPNAWRYRDYVISSFNRDTPWPRFVKEQLATDYFFPNQTELIPALGFLSAGPLELSRASTAPVTFDYLDRDDIVTQTMAVFASTTAHCARCHDHKFDPITQEDYYSLQAIFAGGGKGDRSFDLDRSVRLKRKKLQKILQQIAAGDHRLLLANASQTLVLRWEAELQNKPLWQPLNIQTCTSSNGSTLNKQSDGSYLASGTPPEKEIYTLSAATIQPNANKAPSRPNQTETNQTEPFRPPSHRQFKQLTAIRLDVLPHSSLPMQGPGRCANGNLHLNEVVVSRVESGKSQPVKIKNAFADWNQEGWTISHAIDGNEATAWGIFPKVGKPHYAVFEFETPIKLTEKTSIEIQLKQLHGGSHLIGRFKLSATDAKVNAQNAIAILPESVTAALSLKHQDRSSEQRAELSAFVLRTQTERQLKELPEPVETYGWTRFWSHGKKLDKPLSPKTVHILKRGNILRPGPVATPGTLAVINELKSRFPETLKLDEATRRAELANWIIADQNPLTWRSIVNRVWAYHFGSGICDTPNDFGRMGGTPSHPELLDWLAVWFRDEAKGSFKELHKLILTSQTWQQSSSFSRTDRVQARASRLDSQNRFLWKHSLRRIDAESFRDSLLHISGSIDFKMGGPGVEQFSKSKGRQTTPELHYDAFDWNSPAARRRSIYRVVWRGIADPFFESLDFPDLGLLTAKRESSNSPTQALATLNDDFVLHFCQHTAQRVANLQLSTPDQVRLLCRRIWLRDPRAEELEQMIAYVRQHGLAALCRILINSNEFIFIR